MTFETEPRNLYCKFLEQNTLRTEHANPSRNSLDASAVLRAALAEEAGTSPQAHAEAALRLLTRMVENGSVEQLRELRGFREQLAAEEDTLSICELARMDLRCRDIMRGVLRANGSSALALFEQASKGAVFSLPRNAHKTFEERPGYDNVLLNLAILYRFLVLGLVATLFYVSGGQLAFYIWALWAALAPYVGGSAGELAALAAHVTNALMEHVRGSTQMVMKGDLHGYAPR